MAVPIQDWNPIHTSAYSPPGSLIQRAVATMRAHGALRYQCPVNGSFVLVTDDATLAHLAKPHSRVRCMGCGEMHLLTCDPDKT